MLPAYRLPQGLGAPAPVVSAHTGACAFVQASVATCLAQILPNAAEVAMGSIDLEHVHELRVGLRRLRTVLREMTGLNENLDPAWDAPLAHVFHALGAHRDRDLLAGPMATALSEAGSPFQPAHHPPPGVAAPADLVRTAAFQRSLLATLAFAMAPADNSVRSRAFDGSPLAALCQRLDEMHRRLHQDAKRFATMPAEDQHRVRRRLKRLRYLAEFVAPLFPARRARRYLAALKPAQDRLGARQDEATALALLRDDTREDPKAWFAVGWLTARQSATVPDAAKALRKAARTRRFWHGQPARRR